MCPKQESMALFILTACSKSKQLFLSYVRNFFFLFVLNLIQLTFPPASHLPKQLKALRDCITGLRRKRNVKLTTIILRL